jgi:UDP-glucose 4-epimerase
VTDLARGYITTLNTTQNRRVKGNYRAFNLGTRIRYLVLEVIEAIETILQLLIPRRVVSRRAGDM